MTDIEQRLAQELRRRAAMVDVSPPPLDAIERATVRPGRGRWLVVAGAAAVVATLVVIAATVLSVNSPPPSVSPPLSDWGTRGSLRQDDAVLASVRDRVAAETRLGRESAQTRSAVWFAGDTSAGRIVVGAIGEQSGQDVTRSELLVLAGPRGAPIRELTPVGNSGEPADGAVSRLITRDGHWWLFVLGRPDVDLAEVSWFPRYGPDGRLPRDWWKAPAADGVLVVDSPGRVVAARLRLLRGDQVVTDQPVIEDSDNLNDPSFFPVELVEPTPLRTDVDLRGADRDTVTWLANELSFVVGEAVENMAVTVRWARTELSRAWVLVTVRLRLGGTIAGYAMSQPGSDGTPVRTIGLTPVPDRALDRLTFVHVVQRPDADGPGRLVVIAAHAPGGTVQVLRSGNQVGQARLDDTGYAELAYRSDASNGDVMVVAKTSGGDLSSVGLSSPEQTDPLDLRQR